PRRYSAERVPARHHRQTREGDPERRLAAPDSVRALVSEGDVLVTTVGPFERLGDVAADAAASQGAHYLDSTGEVGFVRRLQERYPAASDDAAA
ncbi:hypothetical protein RA276_28700, partial [Pseudomonas syringae pv. tagetis]